MSEAAKTLLQQGMALHKAGKLGEAKKIYEQILSDNPRHPDSLHLLGLIELDQKHYERAENLVRKAVAEQDNFHIFHNTLGNVLKAQGRLNDAITSYERALNLKPDFHEPLNNLGASLMSLGKLEEAKKYFQRAITANPKHINPIHNMAIICERQKNYDEAIQYYQRTVRLKPDVAEIYVSLGNLLYLTKKTEEAAQNFQKALELRPDDPSMLSKLGDIALTQANYEEALKYYQRLVQLRPDANSYANVALVFQDSGHHEEAIAYYKKALELQPDTFQFLNNLSIIYKNMGRLDKSIEFLKSALTLAPDNTTLYSNLLMTMIYASFVSPEEVAGVARRFGSLLDPLRRKRPFSNDKNPDRKLRIGYVSPDFRSHSVSYFIEPLLNRHDRTNFELYAYAHLDNEDPVTVRLKEQFHRWHDINFLNTDTLADIIEKDQIDILIDLAGHTAHNSLPMFARKPAPVQVTWLGHPTTTGMKAMDYRITDSYVDPEGMTEHLNTETLWRMPEAFGCYQPSANSPDVIDHPPFEDNGYITFGCFNNFTKVTDDVLNLWSKILAQVPNSRLILEIASIENPKFREDVESRIRNVGIPLERVNLEPRKPSNQFVLYNKIDIALDPFPCVGGTTSFDTLWMGVPFVTLAGKHFASRMGVSILTNAGLPELIAQNINQYVEIAVGLANDRAHLKKLRNGLREKVAASPLMDQEKFTRNMEAAYHKMWHKWCENDHKTPEDHIKAGTEAFYRNDYQQAQAHFEKEIAQNPDSSIALVFLAMTFNAVNRFEEAAALCERALQKRTGSEQILVLGLNTLGVSYKNLGQTDKALNALRQASRFGFSRDLTYGNLLLTMVYAESVSGEELAETAREYGRFVSDPLLRKRPFNNDKSPGRKLRIGYVSPDFREHPVTYFTSSLLNDFNRNDFDVYAYSCGFSEDGVTERIRKNVTHWRNIRPLNDDAAADQIEKDQIDILIDLAGHTGQNRLPVFARKPAPVQVTWLGWPATTGMRAMDYRVTDSHAEPKGQTESLSTEILWRLPDIFCCYKPASGSPPVIDHSPFENNGYITFGCFNNFAKVTDDTLSTWAQVMSRVVNSRLLLEISGIEAPKFHNDVEKRFEKAGLPLERVILKPRKKSNQFVLYNKIDIALDPFPCNGGTTSFDTLWMGVPFVTLAGKHFVSRMGVTILTNAGLPELIAQNTGEYVEIAVSLANDPDRLKKLRRGLREKVAASPLMDQKKFVRNMEAAYREMWHKYCAK